MKNTIWSVVLFIFFFVSFDTLKAQDAPKKSLWDELHFWGDVGFGFAIPDIAIGGCGSATINYQNYFISLRGLAADGTPTTQLFINPLSAFDFNRYRGYAIEDEIAITIGYTLNGSSGMCSIGVGPSFLNGYNLSPPIDSNDDGHRYFHNVGFAIDAQLSYSLLSWFGIILHPYIDLNSKRSFGGFMFGIQIGKLFYQ